MPKVTETPAALRPFIFHGLQVEYPNGGEQGTATCPFCNRERKFYISIADGRWSCKVCATGNDKGGGNVYTFLRQLWEVSARAGADDLRTLAEDRSLLDVETLTKWGVVQSHLTGEWLVPGYAVEGGGLNQLYRYVPSMKDEGRHVLLTTPTLNHQLHGYQLFDKKRDAVWITEGPWDGMALWEVLQHSKDRESNVLAVPGCGTWNPKWGEALAGKWVTLLYDNDHPKEDEQGRVIEPAGYVGMRRVAKLLLAQPIPPKGIRYLAWGGAAKDHDPELRAGFDLRDWLCEGADLVDREKRWEELQERIEQIPDDWTAAEVDGVNKDEIECLPCDTWHHLVSRWRKALKWTEGLDRALSVMLACVTSTRGIGDQLWARIISPPSTAKSILSESLAVNRRYVIPKDTLTGLFSGYQVDKEGSEDLSLAIKCKNKTLVIKDGDTVLQAPNKSQILSQFRALYDRAMRTSYGNKMGKDHEGMNITVILCGTSSLRQLDTSELGERFLTCSIMDSIDEELEDEILWRVVNRAERTVSVEADGKLETQHEPVMVEAMRLTGGYVGYLRENASVLLQEVTTTDEAKRECIAYGKFVAYARARPSIKQDEMAEREFASRLVSQIMRLAKCIAVVLNRKTVDAEVMARTRNVALDTAKGQTLTIIKHLYDAGTEGMQSAALTIYTNHSVEKDMKLLRFLRQIGAVELYQKKGLTGGITKKWRLTTRLRKLYAEVYSADHS